MGALQGKVAVVTGASRGIGEAIARRFAAEGAMVAVSARTADESGKHLPGSVKETVAMIEAAGGRAAGFVCDVADPAQRQLLAKDVLDRFGRVDILVNNAAGATYGRLYDRLTQEKLAWLFQLNLFGPLEFLQLFGPGMKERRQGWVLNLSSRTAELPAGPPFPPFDITSGSLMYGTSKAALNRMTAGLAAEFQGTGVAINALAPDSVVWTPGTAASGTEKWRSSPGWREEPVEAMAEAALALCTVDPAKYSGHCVYSVPFLKEIGRAIRTLDGKAELKDWKPAID